MADAKFRSANSGAIGEAHKLIAVTHTLFNTTVCACGLTFEEPGDAREAAHFCPKSKFSDDPERPADDPFTDDEAVTDDAIFNRPTRSPFKINVRDDKVAYGR
jgi:hypothetical protein